jgi:methionyl aminopeptidase
LALIACSRECLDEAIRVSKPGYLFRDLGTIIEKIAKARGFSVNKTWVPTSFSFEHGCSSYKDW